MIQKIDFIRVIRNNNVDFYSEIDEEGNEIVFPENFFRSKVEIHASDGTVTAFRHVEKIDIENTFNGSIVFDNVPNSYTIKCYTELNINGKDWSIVSIRDTNQTIEECEFDRRLTGLIELTGGM